MCESTYRAAYSSVVRRCIVDGPHLTHTDGRNTWNDDTEAVPAPPKLPRVAFPPDVQVDGNTVHGTALDPVEAGQMVTVGRKDDRGKPRWSLLPLRAVQGAVRVLEFGARKYGAENWREVPDAKARYWDAAMRHLVAWKLGETSDPDTGESHLAHAACCVLFLAELELSNGRP